MNSHQEFILRSREKWGEGNKLSMNTLNYHLKELEEKDEGKRERKGGKKNLELYCNG